MLSQAGLPSVHALPVKVSAAKERHDPGSPPQLDRKSRPGSPGSMLMTSFELEPRPSFDDTPRKAPEKQLSGSSTASSAVSIHATAYTLDAPAPGGGSVPVEVAPATSSPHGGSPSSAPPVQRGTKDTLPIPMPARAHAQARLALGSPQASSHGSLAHSLSLLSTSDPQQPAPMSRLGSVGAQLASLTAAAAAATQSHAQGASGAAPRSAPFELDGASLQQVRDADRLSACMHACVGRLPAAFAMVSA